MKKNVLMIMIVLICSIAFNSCSSDKPEQRDEQKKYEKMMDGLYVIGIRSVDDLTYDVTDLMFTENDIKVLRIGESYGQGVHGEIVLNNTVQVEDFLNRFGLYTSVIFFLDNEPIFNPPLKIFHVAASTITDDLELRMTKDNRIFLTEFYQSWEWMPPANREEKLKEQEENSKMRQKQLDVFFKYLNDAGKIEVVEEELSPDY